MRGDMDDYTGARDELHDLVTALDIDSRDEQSNRDAGPSTELFGRPSSNSSRLPILSEPSLPNFSTFASTNSREIAPEAPSSSTSRRPITSSPLSAGPLAALSRSSPSTPRQSAHFMDEHSIIISEAPAEKDMDDPTTPDNAGGSGDRYSTPSALSRLLAAETTSTPAQSRTPSYRHRNTNLERCYSSLPSHLYTRGLLGGRHSDITIVAFGHKYNLHRIILDRAPFFANALTEPWLESTAKEVELHPEDTDKNITQAAFELALKSLYGVDIAEEGEAEAIGLFATGCWLEMQELVENSIDSILRQMCPETLAPLIHTMTEHYYGRAGERILSSAKAMLCRDGWEMPLKNWDGIPGETVREIVGSDGFFVNGEWDRWVIAKRLLDRRLKQKAVECGLVDANNRNRVKAPETIGLISIRFDTLYRKNAITSGSQNLASQSEKWISLYTHPDIEPVLVLLDEGIHYVHLEFEQLQYIRQARDVFGLLVLPDNVVTNALWMQLELRQKVLNAREGDLELGLSQPAEPPAAVPQLPSESEISKGKRKLSDAIEIDVSREDDDINSGSWDSNGRPRKFWIPSTDCNIVMGGNAEPVYTTNISSNLLRHVNRMSATIEPPDVQWATDFASSPSTNIEGFNRPTTPAGRADGEQPKPVAYTAFPPFRFAAEFPNPRLLKEKKRVYSRTVFYAGSLWNIYIQKVRSQKNPQLGVYLHRAKERETEDIMSTAGGISSSTLGSVDERIGLLEREMILRSEQRSRVRGTAARDSRRRSTMDTMRTNRDSTADSDATTLIPDSETASLRSTFTRRSLGRPTRHDGAFESYIALDSDTDDDDDTLHWSAEAGGFSSLPPKLPRLPFSTAPQSSHSNNVAKRPSASTATLPPYVDPRPTIRTYFKIYSPSKGGRLLSVYESAPDKFDFSQSWGWRSSTLMLDEVFLQEPEVTITDQAEEAVANTNVGAQDGARDGENAPSADSSGDNGVAKAKRERERRKREGVLRFMVVIGNL